MERSAFLKEVIQALEQLEASPVATDKEVALKAYDKLLYDYAVRAAIVIHDDRQYVLCIYKGTNQQLLCERKPCGYQIICYCNKCRF